VISSRICPHTGIVNYFIASDPLLAVGSVTEGTTPTQFDWRCYLDDPVAGTAPDMRVAENALRRAIALRRQARKAS
jgi:hypothetical protein